MKAKAKLSTKSGRKQAEATQGIIDAALDLLAQLIEPFDAFPLAVVITNKETSKANFITIRAHSDNKQGQKMMNAIMVGFMANQAERFDNGKTKRSQ